MRYDEKTRAFNAVTFCIMTIFSSGVSLYALALLFENLLGWNFSLSIAISAGIVLLYTYMGGLTSVIYNEVLQFCLIVLGILPVVYAGLHRVGGLDNVAAQIPQAMSHLWAYTGSGASNPMGIDAFSMVFGLGVFLSFGYWCTDYLVIQRAMAAHDLEAAQLTPVVGSFPKLLLPIITITPGLIAVALVHSGGSFQLPIKADGHTNYDLALPLLLAHFYPHGLFGLGLTALMASFMSGMAGNVTAFNSVLTYDIYENYIRKGAPDSHYLKVGRFATVAGILLSIGTAYVARSFNNIMDLLQMVFGFVNAPLFAVFLLGMFWKRSTGRGAFLGLLSGTTMAAITLATTTAEGKGGWITNLFEFRSAMAQSFAVAIISWSTCFVATILFSMTQKARPQKELEGLVYGLTKKPRIQTVWYKNPAVLAAISAVITIGINFYFW
jgi:SSS family solute:Na+ symporter